MVQSKVKYNGNDFLAWGYSTIFFSLLVYICIRQTDNILFYLLYVAIPISANIIGILLRKSKTKSDTEILIDKIWILFGILTILSCIGRCFYPFPLFAFVSFLMGIETIVTGIIIRNKKISVLGFSGIFGTIPLIVISGYEQNLIISVIFLLIAVIPGHLANMKDR